MARADNLPRIPGPKPSIINHDMGIGMVVGQLVAGAAAFAFLALAGPSLLAGASVAGIATAQLAVIGSGLAGTIGGALIGGSNGKKRMEREQVEGREVHEPTFFNKGILSGLWLAFPIGSIVFSFIRKNEMEQEVKQAEGIAETQRAGHFMLAQHVAIGHEHAQQQHMQVTTEDMALLNERMRGGSHQMPQFVQNELHRQEAAALQSQEANR